MSDLYAWLKLLNGPEYSYLGHFLEQHNLCRGHNESGMPELSDAERVDEGGEKYGESTAPNRISDKPGGAG